MEGGDPLGWLYKAEHYFDFFGIDDLKKVKMASFHMEMKLFNGFSGLPKLERLHEGAMPRVRTL